MKNSRFSLKKHLYIKYESLEKSLKMPRNNLDMSIQKCCYLKLPITSSDAFMASGKTGSIETFSG